jgi:hypothetical protein
MYYTLYHIYTTEEVHGMPHKPDGSTRISASHTFAYRLIKVQGRWVREHRHVMEQTLGRPLLRAEHVHHIDHDTLNNDPTNLMVLSGGEHTRLHHAEHAGRWSRRYAACVTCGTTERRYESRGMCTACYAAWRYANDPEGHMAKAYASRKKPNGKLATARYSHTTSIPRHRERMNNDPDYRARHNEYKRQWYLRKKAAKAAQTV